MVLSKRRKEGNHEDSAFWVLGEMNWKQIQTRQNVVAEIGSGVGMREFHCEPPEPYVTRHN
jgi:hypothetical protein